MRVALLFPGQGSQVLGMGKDFFENFRESQLVFEEASDAAKIKLKRLCFDGPMDELTLTENLQPALYTTEIAILAAIRAHAEPKIMAAAGHSLGEFSALCAAGSMALSDGALLTRARGEAMQRAVPPGEGTMAAVLGLAPERVESLCDKAREESGEVVEPANFNAPGQVVIAGSVAGVEKCLELLKTSDAFKGGKAIPLKVSAPFHCSLMKPAQDAMTPLLDHTKFLQPNFPVITNVDAKVVTDGRVFSKTLQAQIVKPVRWEQSMGTMKTLSPDLMIEVGPGKVLTGLQKRIDANVRTANISSVETMKEVFKK